jgi:O-antigen/teichoic acid export membrane protein
MTAPSGVFRGTLLYIVSRLVPAILTFLAIGLYTRFLSTEEYGLYALILSIVSLVSSAAIGWIYMSVVRLLAASPDPARFQASVLLSFLAVVALVVTAGVPYLLLVSQTPGERLLILLAGFLLIVQGWMEINFHFLIARGQAWLYTQLSILRAVLGTAVGVGLAALGWGAGGILLGTAIGMLAPTLWLSWFHWRGIDPRRADRRDIRAFHRFGLPLTLGLTLDNVTLYSDRLVLGWLADTQAVGLYAVGYDIADKALKSIMQSVGAAALPTAVRLLEQEGEEAARRQLERNAVILVSLGLPATVGLSLVAPEIAALVGPEFREAVAALIPPIAAGTFLACLRSNYLDHAFHLSKRALPLTLVTAGTAVLNLVLNLILVPRLGVMGAAYATLGSFLFGALAGYAAGRRLFRLPLPWTEFLKIGAAVCTMAATIFALPDGQGAGLTLVLKVAAGGLSYLGTAVALDIGGVRRSGRLGDLRGRLPGVPALRRAK